MKNWLYAGLALLVVQIGLAVFLNANSRSLAAFKPHENLLHFSPAAVDGITVFGPKNSKVTLRKVSGSWLLPELFKAPAKQGKVKGLLQKLANLKEGLAVATTRDAADRFKVGKDDFERHVVLQEGNQAVADFYLGTSPEFRMVHARVKGRPEVVSVKLSTYELEAKPDRWLDRHLVAVNEQKIRTFDMGDIHITHQKQSWRLAGLAAGQELNTPMLNALLEKIETLTVEGVVDPAAHKGLFQQKPTLTIAMTLTDHGKRTYTFAKPAKEDYYVLKSSARPQLFKINSYVVEGLQGITRGSLIKTKKAAAPSPKKAPSHKGSSTARK